MSKSHEMKLRAVKLGSPRKRGEGLRIGTARLWPRGVKKERCSRDDHFDVWYPMLAPSRELLAWARSHDIVNNAGDWKRFSERYEREMVSQTDCRQSLILLAEMAKRSPISIGCYCDDESRCHRGLLLKLIQRAGTKKFQNSKK